MNNDYSRYTDHQVKLGSLNRESDVLSASAISSLVNACYVVSSLDDPLLPPQELRVDGDIAVVSSMIADDQQLISRSTFFWNDGKWEALTGKHSLSNVYFDTDLKLTEKFGHYDVPDKGYYVLSSKGHNLYEVFKEAYQVPTPGIVAQPTVKVTPTATSLTAEVGQTYNVPGASLLFKSGEYQYSAPKTATGVSVYVDNAVISCSTGSSLSNSMTLSNNMSISIQASSQLCTYADDAHLHYYTATVNHTSGLVPLNNLGDEDPDRTILSSTITSTAQCTAQGKRYYFWGYKLDGQQLDIGNLQSDQIRSLSSTGGCGQSMLSAASTQSAKNMSVPSGTKQIIFAAPTGKLQKNIGCYNKSSLNARIDFANGNARKIGIVNVNGYNNYQAMAYDIWYVTFEATLNASDLVITWE